MSLDSLLLAQLKSQCDLDDPILAKDSTKAPSKRNRP